VEPLLPRLAAQLQAAAAAGTPDLYPVLRADCELILAGPLADDLLVQVCNVNFAPLARAATATAGPLALTQMVGVSVTVAPQSRGEATHFRIWCDPSFGPYLKSTLQQIADELNTGEAVKKS
jgi:sarcosine oxidase subunit gamma